MEYKGISKLDLKRRNRMQILKVIREQGPISRVDIASALAITRAAVTIITNEMIEEDVLYEVGEAPVSPENLQKGRRKILIDINPNFKFAFGICINEDSVSIGLSNLKPEVLDKNSITISESTSYEEIVEYIMNETKRILQNNSLDTEKILGAGVSIQPEMCSRMKVYFKDGKLDFANFCETLENKLNMPVTCMNSTNALALANQEKNTEERIGNYMFLKFGKNINMSVLIENYVMSDYIDHTNQIERLICNPNGVKLNGYPDGSVKAELTKEAITEKFKAIYSKENTPILWDTTGGNFNNLNYKTISAAAQRGDANVITIIDSIHKSLAVCLHNFSVGICARYIILHDFFTNDWLFERFKKTLIEICGEEMVKKIRLSRVEKSLEFASGCAISIYEFFYKKGGI